MFTGTVTFQLLRAVLDALERDFIRKPERIYLSAKDYYDLRLVGRDILNVTTDREQLQANIVGTVWDIPLNVLHTKPRYTILVLDTSGELYFGCLDCMRVSPGEFCSRDMCLINSILQD